MTPFPAQVARAACCLLLWWSGPPPAPADVAGPSSAATELAPGVYSKVLRPGHGRSRATENDCVRMRFAGWRRDGSFLASSGDGPSPVDRCLRRIFPGLALALRQMTPGEQRRVWVPARLTFDPDDRESPPGVDATFDLELVEIVRAPPVPQDLKRPPPSALRQPGGLRLSFLQRGGGREHPTERARVKLNFTGWTAAGRLIESSLMAGQPALFELSGVMVGWRRALVQMVPGDKVRLWIPPALAFGDHPRRGQPRGPLVYDLELLAIE